MNPETFSNTMQERAAELLAKLDITATIVVDIKEIEGRKYVDIVIDAGEAAPRLIGFRGSRLKALSTVLSMMLPETEERYSVLIDVNGYRAERTQRIAEDAHRAIAEALENMTEIHLDPMDPWERRIVHMAASDRTDITTESEGDADERHVVIKPVSVV